uniref:Uncharacterized protein n=1 Tax=Plectus sambesii TaxID=2011161 RepID=A0A914V6K1_9BILA
MAKGFNTPLSLGIFAMCFGFITAAMMTSQQCADMNTCSNAGASIIYTLPSGNCDCIFYKVQPGITLEDSHSYCNSLANTYETTCFLGLIINSSTVTDLESAGVITPSTNIFIDLNQESSGKEPDKSWQTVDWAGSNGPATGTPWAPGQPDDNGGANADQGVYTGGVGSLHYDNNDYHEHSHDTANDNGDLDYNPNDNIDDDNDTNNHNNSHNNLNDNNLNNHNNSYNNIHDNPNNTDYNNLNNNDDNEKTHYNDDNEETYYNFNNFDDDDDYHSRST